MGGNALEVAAGVCFSPGTRVGWALIVFRVSVQPARLCCHSLALLW